VARRGLSGVEPAYNKWPELFPTLQRVVMEAARAAGARYVSIDNLYGYGRVSGTLTEQARPTAECEEGTAAPGDDAGGARGSRARRHQRGHRAGVGLLRSWRPALAVRRAHVRTDARRQSCRRLRSADLPHSYAYIEDVGRRRRCWHPRRGARRVWFAPHAPAATQRAMVEEACRQLGIAPRIRVIRPLMMRLAGLFVPAARESVEMLYQFTEPWVVSSEAIESAFGLKPTPIAEGLTRTVAWWRKPRPTAGA